VKRLLAIPLAPLIYSEEIPPTIDKAIPASGIQASEKVSALDQVNPETKSQDDFKVFAKKKKESVSPKK
jgi:hypothetical protein